ncbi:alanine/glycine:cation symporter family protein [Halanaerobacter jeridensis]|uniref:AGCS family alanine or glycine:cation symporter n=1 Tax=Halanaerobacter jeridensis TaxID=706427 RepID=A0A938XQI3_9FIRM|nr:sodium:alanine symporter family protein [Halanaerobacter jeridensis]MBM7555453.1 AGCS family alanine or glycine:cation symporter [Halanaerobacter jeridensis]
MEQIINFFNQLSSFVWGPVAIILLLGTGIYLSIKLRLVQIRKLKSGFQILFGLDEEEETKEGEISNFEALTSALSATIGTGNIAGVGTAIALGGPGALFWMWVTAFFGMATKYASCLLGSKYRVIDENGEASGGPMYYLEKGLNQKWLALLFSLFAILASFGIGNMVQANSVAEPLQAHLNIPKGITGVVLGALVCLVIIGGIKRIGKVASKIVPLMSAVYIIGAMTIIISNFQQLPAAITLIIKHAFSPTSAIGGFAGSAVMMTLRYGIARGVFSNEAGLGSAPMVYAAAKTDKAVREGLVAMVGPLIDTLIICTMTGLVIITTGAWKLVNQATGEGFIGAELTAKAFNLGLPGPGRYLITFSIVFFAFSTILTWSYYGDRSIKYLFGSEYVSVYRWIFVLIVPLGASLKLDLVWALSDVANGLMIFPNLIGILGLSGVVFKMTKDYFAKKI